MVKIKELFKTEMRKISELIYTTEQDKISDILRLIEDIGKENDFLDKFFKSTLIRLMEIGDEVVVENVSNGAKYMIKKIYKPFGKKRNKN